MNPANARDILLTTHTHSDHVNNEFLRTFPGQQLFVKTGSLQAAGVKILGIVSAHNSGDIPQPENGSNYIFLIEMGGLRIATFGDIGQDDLTPAMLPGSPTSSLPRWASWILPSCSLKTATAPWIPSTRRAST